MARSQALAGKMSIEDKRWAVRVIIMHGFGVDDIIVKMGMNRGTLANLLEGITLADPRFAPWLRLAERRAGRVQR